MPKKIRRNRFLNVNKYQRSIILAGFVPMAVLCVSLVILLKTLHSEAIIYVLYGTKNEMVQFLDQFGFWILLLSWSIFLISMVWLFCLSSYLAGPFERILRELDLVIEQKKSKRITARKKDFLANDLLKRINILLEHFKPME